MNISFFNFLGFDSSVASGEKKKSLTFYNLAGTAVNLLVKWFDFDFVDYGNVVVQKGERCVLQLLETGLNIAGKFNPKMAWPFQR